MHAQKTPTKKLSDSFKKKCDNIAQTTTESAPIGVTRMASVKALWSA